MFEDENRDSRWERYRVYLQKEFGDEPIWFKVIDSPSNYSLTTGNTTAPDDLSTAKYDVDLQNTHKEELMLCMSTYLMRETERYRWLEELLWTIEHAAVLLCGLSPDRCSRDWESYVELFTMNGGCNDLKSRVERVMSLLNDAAHSDDKMGVRVNDEMKVRVRECVQWAAGKHSIRPIPIWLLNAFAASPEDPREIDEDNMESAKTGDESTVTSPATDKPVTPRENTGKYDRRSEYTAINAKRSRYALLSAIWHLIQDEERNTYWRGGKINASKLANAVCSGEENRLIWNRDFVELPSASKVSESLQIAARLDTKQTKIRRRHTEGDDVRAECLLLSVLWCLQKDWDKCVRRKRLSHHDIISLIWKHYDQLWLQKEYHRGTKDDELNSLKHLTKSIR